MPTGTENVTYSHGEDLPTAESTTAKSTPAKSTAAKNTPAKSTVHTHVPATSHSQGKKTVTPVRVDLLFAPSMIPQN